VTDRQRALSYRALGRAIREIRKTKKPRMSQAELADTVRMDRAYVGSIERGERRPSYGAVLDLAAGLGVAPTRLVADALSFEEQIRHRCGEP